jgi:hypothetical protein
LMPLVREYYHRPSHPVWNPLASSWYQNSIMSNWPLSGHVPEVVQYCIDPAFRKEIA